MTPEYIADETINPFKWPWLQGLATDQGGLIGALPSEWNHLVGYDELRNDAKLVHYTMGIPMYPETEASEYKQAYVKEHQQMNSAAPWVQLMGQSVHACQLPDGRVLPWFHPDVKAMQDTAKQEVFTADQINEGLEGVKAAIANQEEAAE